MYSLCSSTAAIHNNEQTHSPTPRQHNVWGQTHMCMPIADMDVGSALHIMPYGDGLCRPILMPYGGWDTDVN